MIQIIRIRVTLKVHDGSGSVEQTFNINLKGVNYAPQVTLLKDESDKTLEPDADGESVWTWNTTFTKNMFTKNANGNYSLDILTYLGFTDDGNILRYTDTTDESDSATASGLNLDFSESANGRILLTVTPPFLEDTATHHNLSITASDQQNKTAEVKFSISIEDIFGKPELTGNFNKPLTIGHSHTIKKEDIYFTDQYDDEDTKNIDKVLFTVSNPNKEITIKVEDVISNSFTAKQLQDGRVKLEHFSLRDESELKSSNQISFTVRVTNSLGIKSELKQFDVKLNANYELKRPAIKVYTNSRQFSVTHIENVDIFYTLCQVNSSKEETCDEEIEGAGATKYIENEGINKIYARVKKLVDDNGNTQYSGLSSKEMYIPIIKVLENDHDHDKAIKRKGFSKGQKVTVEIDLLFEPKDYNLAESLKLTNAELIESDNSLSSSSQIQQIDLAITGKEVKIELPSKLFSTKNTEKKQHTVNDFSWTYGLQSPPNISKINPQKPNTFKWNLSSGGGDSIFRYGFESLVWDGNHIFAKDDITAPRKDQWNKDNGDTIDVQVDSDNPDNYTLSIKGSGQYTIEVMEKISDGYSPNAKQTIFIPQFNTFNQEDNLITNNTSNGVSKADRQTKNKKVTVIIDTYGSDRFLLRRRYQCYQWQYRYR
jgi:hypothetical protein